MKKMTQTNLRHGDATMIGTREFSLSARRILTTFFIRAITTIIFVITFPSRENATTILTSEFTWTACVVCCFKKLMGNHEKEASINKYVWNILLCVLEINFAYKLREEYKKK